MEGTGDLFRILGEKSAGDVVTVNVWRNGDPVDVKATLRALSSFDN